MPINFREKKKIITAFVIFIIPIILFFTVRDTAARYAWERHGREDLASVLVWRDTNLLAQLGNYYYGGGVIGGSEHDPGKAKRLYEKALAVDPEMPLGHYQLARIYFTEGDFRNALKEINKELEKYSDNFRSYYVRGLIYGFRNAYQDLPRAEEDFRKFITWSPKEWAGHNDLAWILAKQGKYEDVKKVVANAFEEIPEAREDNPWLWNSRGVAELNLGEYEEARASFEKTREILRDMPFERWRNAYPGNSPEDAEVGYKQFKDAMEKNMEKVKIYVR